MATCDVAIVGGGPAGASCAAFCAQAGLHTIVLEREKFPREKVCGDCINPACWPVLERLGVAERVRALPHSSLEMVEFISIGGRSVKIGLPAGDHAEIAVKRSLFDRLLLTRAQELGAQVHEETTVSTLNPASTVWDIDTADGATFAPRVLVAADGRNSTIARLCKLLPRSQRERIALQAHIPLPPDFGRRVVLQFLKQGYSGQAPVNDSELNVCLVAKAGEIEELKQWAIERFAVPNDQPWRTITPLTRAPLSPAHENLFLIGDAARVVEPFTGEGIYYALRSGEIAANAIIRIIAGDDRSSIMNEFKRAHVAMSRGRLWINRMARAAVLSPRIASGFVHAARVQPWILRMLIAKITG